MGKKYFDLHLHPLFKNFLSHYDTLVPPPMHKMEELTEPVRMSNALTSIVDELFLHILKSQSSISQCSKGGVRYAVAALVNLEFGFADSRGFFGKVLKSRFSNPLDKTFFEKVQKGEVSYYRLLLMELSLYKQLRDSVKSPFDILSRNNTENKQEKPLQILLSLEGLHNISRFLIGNSLKLDTEPDRFVDKNKSIKLSQVAGPLWRDLIEDTKVSEVLPTTSASLLFERFYQNLSREKMDVLYITLTHLTHISEQFLATHAFGLKMLKHPAFYPFGNGITAAGFEVIEKCYTLRNHKNDLRPVVIDVKHLSLKSRQDLYLFRKKLAEKNKTILKIPLLASHAGVTGYTYNEWKNALKRESCAVYNYESARAVSVEMARKPSGKWGSVINDDFTFNPWSINLMDEDIIEILESNGLLGMSLDVRILGFQSEFGLHLEAANEFLSTADFQTHFPHVAVKNLPQQTVDFPPEAKESWLIPTKEDRHPLAFCFNIVHIIQVALLRTDIAEPWKQLCLGSDFDGLIEPLKVSPDITSLPELEANMLKWLPVAENAYTNQNGGRCVFAEKNTAELKQIVRGIMLENGKNFVERWLANFGLPV